MAVTHEVVHLPGLKPTGVVVFVWLKVKILKHFLCALQKK